MVQNISPSGQYGSSRFTVSLDGGHGAFTTIAEAAAAAAAVTGTVYIFPGTYTESLTWPANIAVEGASTGETFHDVKIVGNQTFDSEGNISFQDIEFESAAGDTWTISLAAGAGNIAFEMEGCEIVASGGNCFTSTNAAGNFNFLTFLSCQMTASAIAISASDRTIINSVRDLIQSTGAGANVIDLNDNSICNLRLSEVRTGVGGACIAINSATARVDSFNDEYISSGAANSTAFLFTADGIVRSIQDILDIDTGTFWARATGAFGQLSYASNVITDGNTDVIDPQITQTILRNSPPLGTLIWSDEGASTTVESFTGSFSTAAIALTLPASPSIGDTVAFIVNFAGALTITANAGQTIRLGNAVSGVAGTAVSSVVGNSLTLIYNSSTTSWISQNSVGNWVLT